MTFPFPKAKKSLGQHFLHNVHIAEKIVRLLHVAHDDCVLEIGPGPGALTSLLEARSPRRLVLLEKDNFWAVERQRLRTSCTQAVLIDALRMRWEGITPENPWKIISNLPYNVASPLIWDIFSRSTGVARAVFMIQKEVGERLVAAPGSKAYGALSVWVQSFAVPHWEFIVEPGAFSPPPKVDSVVLSFSPLPLDQRPRDPDLLARLIKCCFQQRRKQLSSIFRQHQLFSCLTALETLSLDIRLRPENLSPRQFQQIALLAPEAFR